MSRPLWRSIKAAVLLGLTGSFTAPAAAAPPEERILVVGVSKGHGSDAHLVKGLGEHLQQTGMLLAADSLSAQDRACESPDCIEELAERQGAQIILFAKLQENAPSTIFITMALFDAVRRAPFQETALCDQCSPDTLSGKLSDVADKLLKQCREARQAPVRTTPPIHVPTVSLVSTEPASGGAAMGQEVTPAPAAEKGFLARLSLTRKTVAGVAGGVGVATLITSIALTATNGQRTSLGCGVNTSLVGDYCQLSNAPIFGTGYALTGALAVTVALALFWPNHAPKTSAVEVH